MGDGVKVGTGVVVGTAVGLGGGGCVGVLVPVGVTSAGGCVGTAVTVTILVAVIVAVGAETAVIADDSGWLLQPTKIRQMKQKNHR